MIKVLDHGYVQKIETWGSDERIVEAARMSTARGFQGWGPNFKCSICDLKIENVGDPEGKPCPMCKAEIKSSPGDEKLLRYLYTHKHFTPFEMAGLVIEVQAPIFVFREWHRHRTQSYNEMSARYVPMPDLNYIPSIDRIVEGSKATKNRQASGSLEVSASEAAEAQIEMCRCYSLSEETYSSFLVSGIPKELARLVLPVGRYSRMRASANLRNWLGFLTLRMDDTAQWEIRQYANVVGDLVSQTFPRVWELFKEGQQK